MMLGIMFLEESAKQSPTCRMSHCGECERQRVLAAILALRLIRGTGLLQGECGAEPKQRSFAVRLMRAIKAKRERRRL